MFWKRKETKEGDEKLPGPKGLPELVGRYMVTEEKKTQIGCGHFNKWFDQLRRRRHSTAVFSIRLKQYRRVSK